MILIKENGKLIEVFKKSPETKNPPKVGENLLLNLQKTYSSDKKSYPIEKLPYKYWSFYNYARKVVDCMKSKIPKVRLKNIYGSFTLMENSPNPNYEAIFTNGIKITTKCGTNIITIAQPKEEPKTIQISPE